MNENVTNLRQAESTVVVRGVLSEKALEFGNKDGKKHISGYLMIQTGEDNFIRINTYAQELKKDGGENPTYKGLLTVMDQFKSIASEGRDEATLVYTRGTLNPYTTQNGNVITGVRSSFFSRIKEEDFTEPEASVELELFVNSITPEVYTSEDKRGEETGRAVVKGWFPTYDGIQPIELIAPSEDGIAEAFLDAGYQNGDTVKFFGEFVNRKIERTKEIPVKIGKPKIETTFSYINEIRLTGASEAYEEDSAFPRAAVERAIEERDINLKSKENEPTVRKASVGASKGRQLPF